MFIHLYSCVASIYEYTKYVCFCKMEIRYIIDDMHSVRKHLCWKLSACICVCVYNCIYILYSRLYKYTCCTENEFIAYFNLGPNCIWSWQIPSNSITKSSSKSKTVTSSTHSPNKNIAPAMGFLVVPVLSCSLFFQVLFQLLPCLSNQGFYLVSKHRLIGHHHFVSKGRPIWFNQKTKEKESLNHLGYLGDYTTQLYRDYNKPL